MKSTKLIRVLLIALTALIVLAPQAAFAGQPVDPSTLNPPLRPSSTLYARAWETAPSAQCSSVTRRSREAVV